MKTICDACNSLDIKEIYALGRIPAFQNKLFPTQEKALATTPATVSLCHCAKCDLVFNAAFDNALMDYDEDYQNAQDHSPTFREYLEQVAGIITENIARDSARVVEIGCGKGYFLQHLLDDGYDVVGFDPTYEGDDPRIVKEYFNKDTGKDISATHVIMRHTLEHIERPYDFLRQLKSILSLETVIFIEIPRVEWIFEHDAFWDIFHEHCNYFSETFFNTIFTDHAKIHRTFGDQYMIVEARIGDLIEATAMQNLREGAHPQGLFATADFARKLKTYKKNYVWGAGAKGIAFVNILDPSRNAVECVIDINKAKQDFFIPLTGHPCVAPSSINWADLGADACLWIMNGNYKKEILDSLPADRRFEICVIDEKISE